MAVDTLRDETEAVKRTTTTGTAGEDAKTLLSSTETQEEVEEEEEEEEERINPAYREWKQRRREWTKGNDKTTSAEDFQEWIQHGPLKDVPEDAYENIYKMLVKDCRQLKQPMNLADAVRVMKAGWQADGTWPE